MSTEQESPEKTYGLVATLLMTGAAALLVLVMFTGNWSAPSTRNNSANVTQQSALPGSSAGESWMSAE